MTVIYLLKRKRKKLRKKYKHYSLPADSKKNLLFTRPIKPMKTLLLLLLLFASLSCDINESHNFAYRIETDTEITSDVTYYLDGYYEEERITTPWQSDSMTIADDFFSFYIELEYSPSGGRFYILRDGTMWRTQSFFPGYWIEFSEDN